MDKSFSQDFIYSHKNPYHEKLSAFDDFVFRDHLSEENKGRWNKDIFKKEANLNLEIGSGYGHFMMEYCLKNPDINFVGLDYRFKRSYTLVKKLQSHPYKNFRYLRAKGERIDFIFEEDELNNIFYFFPDPWPKARHNKKRLFQRPFLERAYRVLRPMGKIFIKTDHDEYANWMLEVINNQDLFELKFFTNNLWEETTEQFLTSFQTKFEKIFRSKNINIKGFVLESKK